MKKFKKALVILTIAGAVGVSYALYNLKGLPDAFDWENEDE